MQQPVSGFDQIMKEYTGRVYNHAHRMLGSREDAEEAVQDVFRKVHAGLSEFRGEARLSTWIWRITANVCLTRLSKKRMDAVPVEDGLVDESRSANPECNLMEQEEHERLAGLIAALDPHEASAINLFYYEGMKYGEISEILGIPPGSVATALHRGREKLRMLCLKKKER